MVMQFDREAVVLSFVGECEEGLSATESALLQLESDPNNSEAVAGIFRVVHTLKGNALLLGFESLASFAHEVENILDKLRSGKLQITPMVTSVLLGSVDALRAAVVAFATNAPDVLPGYQHVRAQLSALANGQDQDPSGNGELSEQSTCTTPGTAPPDALKAKSLRVSVEKLDRLLNLTGEISIARGRMRQILESRAEADLRSVLDIHADVDRLFLDLQDIVMRARMVPLGPVFRQCVRAARDIAAKVGKQAELVISGQNVEVDTSISELIRDPLMHMVRNALDHGIESPDERRAAGKHPRGRLELTAQNAGGYITVELRDDGRGVDVNAVRERAEMLGLLEEGEDVSNEYLYRLLFDAGFSTAKQVTDISGRGVGLEVVRRNIEALRGSVNVSTESGFGTAIRIHLPVTLAILEGFLVGVGDETFVVPLEDAVECLDFSKDNVAGTNGSAVVDFRGSPLPALRLRNVFDVAGEANPREKVLVVRHHDSLAGFIVDGFYGQRQVVIKSLGRLARSAYGISGSTILGNGRVALLLDVPRLLNDAIELTRTET
jgi:two-component system chemotaxis sensor kinase CheA